MRRIASSQSSRRRVAASALALTTAIAGILSPREALAVDAEVESQTSAQAYQLRGPTGDPILSRRRITQTLGLGVYDLLNHGKDTTANAPVLQFRVRMRLDGDFGMSSEEYALANNSTTARFVPGLAPAPVDVMYGYLEGKRLLGGVLAFKLGRQYVIDSLGYYAFDGGLVRITTPLYFTLEAYGGFEVRAGLPLSNGRWELGGIQRGNRSDYPSTAYPSFQKAGLAPTWAIALESAGPTWIHGRLTYRKAWNTGQSFVGGNGALLGPDQLGIYDRTRVSSERIGYGVNATLGEVAALRGVVNYDLVGKNWTDLQAGADFFLGEHVVVGSDYTFFRPLFDADSIFSVFGFEPMDDVSARIEVSPTDRLSFEADAMVRRYRSDDASDPKNFNKLATSLAPGGGLRARYKWANARLSVRGQGIMGDQGDRIGGDVLYERTLAKRWLLDLRLSLWHFEDKLRTQAVQLNNLASNRSATSLGYVLGAGYQLSPEANAMLQFEHDTNRLVGQRFRLMAVVNVRTWL